MRVKCSEIIADNLSKAGWSDGYVSAVHSYERRMWIADAHWGRKSLKKEVAALTAGLQKVSAQLEASKPAPQVVNNP